MTPTADAAWAPVVRVARGRLRARCRRALRRLTASARGDLERALRARLAAVGEGPHAPLAATVVSQWVDATAELVTRWDADRPAVARALHGGRSLGRVRRVRCGLSDPHGGGRTVMVLETARGAAAVYKPRSMQLDVAFAALVAWLGAAAPSLPPLRAVRALDRGAYGWAEHVAAAPCEDVAARRRYYERAGALLCLAYVLRGSDLHGENVIAAGEHPMLVDLEALLSPVMPAFRRRDVRRRGEPDASSVLHTGLLPTAFVGADGRGFVTGGIAPRATGDETRMRRAVARGFDQAWRAVRARRAELLARGGPLAAFRGAPTRLVLRATSAYAALLRRASLCDPAARDAALAVLDGRGVPAAAVAAERAALVRGDVPMFHLAADGVALHADGARVVARFASLSGLGAARRRVRALTDAARVAQRQYVRVTLAADAHRRLARDGPALDGVREIAALLRALAVGPRQGRATWWGHRDGTRGVRFARLDATLLDGQAGVALFLGALASAIAAAPAAERDDAACLARAAFAAVAAAVRRGALSRVGGAGGAAGVGFALAAGAIALGSDELADAAARAALAPRHARGCGVWNGVAGDALGALAAYDAYQACGARDRDELLGAAVRAGDELLARMPSILDDETHDGRRGGRARAGRGAER